MKKKSLLFLFAAITLSVSAANARNIWRECGIGGMLFKDTGWAAITSNIIWDLGTTATSSNASSDDLCEGPTASTAHFINETYVNLEEEAAQGQGQHLTTMLNMMGCDAQAHPAILSGVRVDVKAQISTPAYSTQSQTQNAEVFYNSVVDRVQTQHAAQCSVI